jgi:MinD-like ATPase involved in chromosome partitioning or flagellar assembly
VAEESAPKVISVFSRTPECGKKTITLNTFLTYARLRPGIRVLIVDFSRTEKMRYSLLKYGKSLFTSMDFFSEIPEDTLVNEALLIYEDREAGSFLRVLPSSGCPISESQTNLLAQVKYRINSLFFKDSIDLLVFIVPVGLEENGITMTTILQSDLVWILSTEKYPTVNLTKSTIKNFLTFLTVPTFLIVNKVQPPLVLGRLDQLMNDMERKFRHPIFYTVPWLSELNQFADQGIFVLENSQSKINEIFQDLSNTYQAMTETRRFQTLEEEKEGTPIALFFTDKSSGESMYYYFFGKAEDEMKNPALITAALNSIALMVSETAGRPGDLRSIDNGNTKIILRKGKRIIGILYSPTENDFLADLLSQCVIRFEKEYKEAIDDFSKTGRLGGFTGASKIIEDIFEQFIFDIETVSEKLKQKILAYATEKDQLHDDPEEIFRNYVKIYISDPTIKDLLMYEFTTPHNSRHELLLELGINPRKNQRALEIETGRKICQCTEPPKYVQIQRFDALGILDLPENLRPTARALFTSDILSPETAAKITKRDEEIELESLEELRKLGYVRRVSTTSY